MSFDAYFKHAFLKQYEKFATYLRNELVANNLADFHLRKGLDHLHAVREAVPDHHRSLTPASRRNGSTSMSTSRCCNVSPSPHHHRRGPLSRHQAARSARHPPLRGPPARHGSHVGGWTAKQIHPGCPRHLPALRHTLRHQPTPLRSAQTQRPRPAAAGVDPATPTPPLPKRRPEFARCCSSSSTKDFAVRSHTAVPPRPVARHQPPSKLETAYHARRQSHPTDRRSACRVTVAAAARLLNAFGQGFAQE